VCRSLDSDLHQRGRAEPTEGRSISNGVVSTIAIWALHTTRGDRSIPSLNVITHTPAVLHEAGRRDEGMRKSAQSHGDDSGWEARYSCIPSHRCK